MVRTSFRITDAEAAAIRQAAAGGEKHFPQMTTDIVDLESWAVARVAHTACVRRRTAP